MASFEVYRCERCGRTSRGKKCRYCPKRPTAVALVAIALIVALGGCGVVVVGDHTTVHQQNQAGLPGQARAERADLWAEALLPMIYVVAAVLVAGVFWLVLFPGRYK